MFCKDFVSFLVKVGNIIRDNVEEIYNYHKQRGYDTEINPEGAVTREDASYVLRFWDTKVRGNRNILLRVCR